jgi:hypothetical protein
VCMQLCHAGPVQVFCTAAQARWQRLHRQQAAWQWAGTIFLIFLACTTTAAVLSRMLMLSLSGSDAWLAGGPVFGIAFVHVPAGGVCVDWTQAPIFVPVGCNLWMPRQLTKNARTASNLLACCETWPNPAVCNGSCNCLSPSTYVSFCENLFKCAPVCPAVSVSLREHDVIR